MQITETKPTERSFTLTVTPDELKLIYRALGEGEYRQQGETDDIILMGQIEAFAEANNLDLDA